MKTPRKKNQCRIRACRAIHPYRASKWCDVCGRGTCQHHASAYVGGKVVCSTCWRGEVKEPAPDEPRKPR